MCTCFLKSAYLSIKQMNPLDIITSLGLTLPPPAAPGGNYLPVNLRGNIAYVSIQFPKKGSEFLYKGRFGNELSTSDGYLAMELCALNVLAQIREYVGFENLVGLNHMDAYFQATANWDESPAVVNGASDLFVKVLGEKGVHSRSIFGVDRLPKNFAAGISCHFTLNR
jgi:enamine deaminase RidA (YjgF/YER057c/UK114 family)